MTEKYRKTIIVLFFAMIFLLVSGCGERTTVYTQYADDERGDGTGEIEVYSLQIVAFSFDSTNPESPVTVRWEAAGDFPEGFMLAWSPDNPAPMPGQHGWVPIVEDDAREVHVKLNDKVPHYFRLCRVKEGACSGFSDTIQVVFSTDVSNSDTVDEAQQQAQLEATRAMSAELTRTRSVELTRTKEAEATPTTTSFPEGSVTLTGVDTDDKGTVTVQWNLTGSAPEGFRVIWSGRTNTPSYPESESNWLRSERARSLAIEGFLPGIEYHYRVCIVTGGDCLSYSHIISYRVPHPATTTPKPTNAVTPTPIGGGPPSLSITSLQESAAGIVKIQWQKTGSFPSGYRILWVEGTGTPTYPGSDQAVISKESSMSGFVKNLTAGKTYSFRLCGIVSGGCGTYSDTKKITLGGSGGGPDTVVLKTLSSAGCDSVKVVWTAAGAFPNGFKVVYSPSNPSPVYPGDSNKYVDSKTARNTVVNGLTQDTEYYFRVCKYVDGACVLYSNVKTFTVPCAATKTPTPGASSISLKPIIDAGGGSLTIKWTAAGSFPQGFKVVWSDDDDEKPTFPGDDSYWVSSPSARSVTISGFDDDETYYFRVCRYMDGACDTYSNMRLIELDD